MDAATVKTVALAAAVAVVGVLVYKASKAGGALLGAAGTAIADGAAAVGQALNPASDQNLINRGVNAAGAAATGDPAFTVGGAVWETVNGGETGSLWGNYKAWVSDFWGAGSAALPQASYDETARLAARYPAPVTPAGYSDPGGYDFGGTFGYGSP